MMAKHTCPWCKAELGLKHNHESAKTVQEQVEWNQGYAGAIAGLSPVKNATQHHLEGHQCAMDDLGDPTVLDTFGDFEPYFIDVREKDLPN